MSPTIKKTLLTTLVLLVLYTLYTACVDPDFYIKQQQWQENAVKAQRYLFGPTPKKVIVGSSLSAKLTDALPGYYNLAFSGQGDFDGLPIILDKKQVPDTVFIEMNTLLVPGSKDFVNNMTNPALNVVRENILPFREGKQPLPVVVYELDRAVNSIRGSKNKTSNGRSTALMKELIAAQVKKYSVAPKAEAVQDAITQLRKYVDALEAKKVMIIFFDLPVHQKLCDLPLSRTIRAAFYANFPAQRYRYISKPDCKDYKTTDGIHFTARDAGRYAKYFKSELTKLPTIIK